MKYPTSGGRQAVWKVTSRIRRITEQFKTGSIIVPITEVEPPHRIDGLWFRDRHTVVKLLQSIRNGVALPPIEVWSKGKRSALYTVRDGFHRFYLSIAVGFTEIPLDIDDFDLDEFFANEARGNQCAI